MTIECNDHDGDTTVRRNIEVGADAAALWELLGDGARWRDWLVDEGTVDVEPGATSEVIDQGEPRTVRIDHVTPGSAVSWTWWPTDRPDRASHVTVDIDATEAGAVVLRVVEVLPATPPRIAAGAAIAWEVRAAAAWLTASSPVVAAVLARA